ncbi:MAG: hypothetical protein ACTHM6_09820 [Tepidisphaeraceae bacterium]
MRFTKRLLLPTTLLLAGLAAHGCNVLGAIAAKAPRPDIAAAYQGLAHQTVGVMIWADRSLLMDWPNLPLDMSNSIVNKLQQAIDAESKDVEGLKFPYPPASYVKYQKEHPAIENEPITSVAPRLGITRLIYVEVNDLSTRSDNGVALFLGRMNCTMKVIEIKDGKAKVAYQEDNIHVQYPEFAPKEGMLNKDDRTMYGGALDMMTSEIVKRLIQHPDDSKNKG